MHERTAELETIAQALDSAARGRGGTVLIEGPAGIGKTTVLVAARDAAHRHGIPASSDPFFTSELVMEDDLMSLPVSELLSTSLPVTDSFFRSVPVRDPFFTSLPVMETAAKDVAPSATKRARVAATLLYVGCGIRMPRR